MNVAREAVTATHHIYTISLLSVISHTHTGTTHTETHSNLSRPSLIGHLSGTRLHLASVEHSLTFQTADLSSPATTK